MAQTTPQDLANTVNSYTGQELEQFNMYCSGQVAVQQTGASQSIQDVAQDIDNLSETDKTTFSNSLDSASGGSKKVHFPC